MGGRRATFPRLRAVSSPLRGLTSLFGMGRGAPPRMTATCLSHGSQPCAFRHGRGRKAGPSCRTCVRVCVVAIFRSAPADICIVRPGKPSGPLVPLGSTSRNAPTCGLSTWSSTTALKGGLISGRASRLDAFSAYPLRTRLPGSAPGGATGSP